MKVGQPEAKVHRRMKFVRLKAVKMKVVRMKVDHRLKQHPM